MTGSMGFGNAPAEPDKPPAFLGGSVLVTIFCCLPFGIVAVVYGVLVGTRWRAGDIEGSAKASRMAESWMHASIGAAVLLFIATALYRLFVRVTTGK